MASHDLTPLLFTSLFLHLLLSSANVITVEIVNRCPYTVWAAAFPGGGRRLNRYEGWFLAVANNAGSCRIWGRTHCSFNDAGLGRCETGDCGGKLACITRGKAPHTGVDFTLNRTGMDYYHLSLTKGFNVPIELSPGNPADNCNSLRCSADITGQCPVKLKAPGGCNDPCTVFKTGEECCTTAAGCGQTTYNKFFKHLCPQAWSYPNDNSTVNCPAGKTFRVTFCPI